jgi:hypothetical protein
LAKRGQGRFNISNSISSFFAKVDPTINPLLGKARPGGN